MQRNYCKPDVEILGAAIPQNRCLQHIHMAKTLTLAFLVIALTCSVTAQETNPRDSEKAKEEVLKVSERISKARAAKDRAELERIFAYGLVWTARGDRLSKDQVIADMLSDKLHFKSFAHDNVAVKIFGSAVVLTGHSTSVLEYKGKLFDAPRLFTDVFVKMDGRWQLVVHDVFEITK